jgi:hypothetical protein
MGLERVEKVLLEVPDENGWTQWLSAMRVGFADELKDESLPNPNEDAFKQFVEKLKDSNSAFAFATPRGIGLTAWNPNERKQTQIHRRFMLLAQTLDGMRVWDVRRAIQALHQIDSLNNVPVALKGQNIMAGIVLYASLFEPEFAGLELWHLPNSHRDGPVFLNILRYMDIPQAVTIAAERTQVRIYPEK